MTSPIPIEGKLLGICRTQGLKVFAQFTLNADHPDEMFVLPQPSPKRWSRYTEANKEMPAATASPDNAPPYWQIEVLEITV